MRKSKPYLSIVVPVYNEAVGIKQFHTSLMGILKNVPMHHEVLYVDDGSCDGSAQAIRELSEQDATVSLLKLTRNFGKEIATTAGLHAATGDAVLMMDADGQHPVEVIPEFIAHWQAGAQLVVGLPTNRKKRFIKHLGSKLFYGMFRRLSGVALNSEATDFRLIDRSVQAEFNRLTERNRITRGLIDWLGYTPTYVSYRENPRLAGEATYSMRKLLRLAIDSAISLTTSPLYLVAYIGGIVLPLATILGLGMIVNVCLGDPLQLHAKGGAYLLVLLLWLIGVLLVSQGIIGLYLSHIHAEAQGRPLYIIDNSYAERR